MNYCPSCGRVPDNNLRHWETCPHRPKCRRCRDTGRVEEEGLCREKACPTRATRIEEAGQLTPESIADLIARLEILEVAERERSTLEMEQAERRE